MVHGWGTGPDGLVSMCLTVLPGGVWQEVLAAAQLSPEVLPPVTRRAAPRASELRQDGGDSPDQVAPPRPPSPHLPPAPLLACGHLPGFRRILAATVSRPQGMPIQPYHATRECPSHAHVSEYRIDALNKLACDTAVSVCVTHYISHILGDVCRDAAGNLTEQFPARSRWFR